ncbi:MAG: hypothetical protein ACE3JK_01860 [Sporolactobacillus sp.]
MNLLTDELKSLFSEHDWSAVRSRIDCIEQMYLRWELNMSIGRLEDADSNVDEICRCMDDIIGFAERKHKTEILTTMEHLKIMRMVVRKHE